MEIEPEDGVVSSSVDATVGEKFGPAKGEHRSHLDRANAARDRHDWAGAARFYELHLRQRSRDFPVWVQLGHSFKEAGRRADSLVAYNRALTLRPDDADLLLNLGHLHKVMGHLEVAASYYERSLAKDGNGAARTELEAIQADFSSVASGPGLAAAPASRLRSPGLLRLVSKLDTIVRHLTTRPVRHVLAQANVARDRHEWAAAAELYGRYVRVRPRDLPALVQLGHALKEDGRRDEALRAYSRALEIEPDNADLLLSLGHLHKIEARGASAAFYYQKSYAQNCNANARDELEALGVAPLSAALGPYFSPVDDDVHRPQLARFRRLLSAVVNAVPVRSRLAKLGDAARARGDWGDAAKAYQRHLNKHPLDFSIWVQLGHALKEVGQIDNALAAYNRALQIDPNNADLLLSVGHIHKLVGQRGRALWFYRRSVERDGNVNALDEFYRLISEQHSSQSH